MKHRKMEYTIDSVHLTSLAVRLLQKVQGDDFVPSTEFEKILVDKFYETLVEFVTSEFENKNGQVLAIYLKCLLIVNQKDEKFVNFLGKLDDALCLHLMSIVRAQINNLCEPELFTLVLKLIHLVVIQISSKRSILISQEFHKTLMSALKDHVEHISLVYNIINKLIEDSPIVEDFSYTAYLISSLDLIDQLRVNHCQQEMVDLAVGRALQFCNLIANEALTLQSSHVSILTSRTLSLVQAFPKHESLIKEVNQRLIARGSGNRSAPTQHLRPRIERGVLMSLSQLKINPNPTSQITGRRAISSASYIRYDILTNRDPETNFFRACATASDINDNFAVLVTAMLNSNKGGKIYIGVDKAGRINGTRLKREERDSLRTGFDSLLRKTIKPLILAADISIDFHPVKSIPAEEDLFVVVLTLPANMNTMYYIIGRDACYQRQGSTNVQLTLQEVRRQTVLFTEKRYNYCARVSGHESGSGIAPLQGNACITPLQGLSLETEESFSSATK